MKTMIATAAAVALLVLPASSAVAQETPLSGLSIRVGAFFPTDGGARSVSKTWFNAGLDYKIRDLGTRSGRPAELGVSLDWINRDDYRIAPLLATYKTGLGERAYVVGGLGVAFSRRPTGNGTEEKARLAFTLGLGYNLNMGATPFFVEGRFIGNERSEFNGFALYGGIRF